MIYPKVGNLPAYIPSLGMARTRRFLVLFLIDFCFKQNTMGFKQNTHIIYMYTYILCIFIYVYYIIIIYIHIIHIYINIIYYIYLHTIQII